MIDDLLSDPLRHEGNVISKLLIVNVLGIVLDFPRCAAHSQAVFVLCTISHSGACLVRPRRLEAYRVQQRAKQID